MTTTIVDKVMTRTRNKVLGAGCSVLGVAHLARRTDRGMSLVESAIILSVLAALTGVLTPAIRNYTETARQARARQDARAIAEAINLFINDNGESNFLTTGNGGGAVPPARTGRRVDLLVGEGDIPTLGPSVADETFWTEPVDGVTVDMLARHLIQNAPGDDTSRRYRNPSDVRRTSAGGQNIDFARPESSGFNARFGWRGSYLASAIEADPWGSRYAVNVAFLDPRIGAVVRGITSGFGEGDYPRLDVFVLSAGPDHEIDTRSAQDGAVAGDNDILAMVSSHAK
jgi:type II secretory pathway pseudopilin PulG